MHDGSICWGHFTVIPGSISGWFLQIGCYPEITVCSQGCGLVSCLAGVARLCQSEE